MKLSSIATFVAASWTATHAFSPTFRSQFRQATNRNSIQHAFASTSLRMSDFDFPSAMPAKPKLTTEEIIQKSADQFVETMTLALGEGVQAPPELIALRNALKNGAGASELSVRVYELMIERGMLYDEEPETGTLTPTEFDIKANLEVKEVQNEFAHLYKYGMMLMDKGLLSAEDVKTTVLERLINRTGLTPAEFDTWLGY
jgi:hypothetical protein